MLTVDDELQAEKQAAGKPELPEENWLFPPDDTVREFVDYLMDIGLRF